MALVAILVLGILIFIYLQKTRPQLCSARVFFAFLNVAFINVLFEIIEYYVFVALSGRYNNLRRLVQNLYVGSIIVALYCVTIYFYSKVTIRRVVSPRICAYLSVPMVLSFIAILFGRASYGRTSNGYYYSYGKMTEVCYLIGIIQLLVILVGLVV